MKFYIEAKNKIVSFLFELACKTFLKKVTFITDILTQIVIYKLRILIKKQKNLPKYFNFSREILSSLEIRGGDQNFIKVNIKKLGRSFKDQGNMDEII